MSFPIRRPPSLRRRLLRWVILVSLLIWGLAAALSYRQARHEVQELMDGQMAEAAGLLLAQAQSHPDGLADLTASIEALREVRGRRSRLTLEFQIVGAEGRQLSRSARAPSTPLSGESGYADIDHEGEPWRSLIMKTATGDYRIQVAQSIRLRDKEALEIARKTVLPLALLLPLLIGLIYFSVRRGLKPLDDLASDVSARSADNLGTLNAAAAPREAKPLVEALNQLLLRLAARLENERRFTADAAHELRTPLAAVKIQAQVAIASPDAVAQRHALDQVVAGAERATRLVEQLLRLARLDPLARLADPHEVDLVELARNAAVGLPVELSIPDGPVRVSGDADLLGVALRNLVDNALRYSPEGSLIKVVACIEHGEPVLKVTDNGPGVPAEELPRLVERFYRGRDVESEGSGLGLAIVRRIAELHGARLEVENAVGGGFSAQLRWIGQDASSGV